MSTKTLYRPVGLHEMMLIIESGLRRFPPRLAHQPIFYPVLNFEYAAQIAREWNARDEKAGYAGFVTQFEVDSSYVEKFEEHVVGSATVHRELWVPAEELDEFNDHIVGIIRPVDAFYGDGYEGPRKYLMALRKKSVIKQFISFEVSMDDYPFDFFGMVHTEWTAILLNFKYWAQHDFSGDGVIADRKQFVLAGLLQLWDTLRGKGDIPDCDPVGRELASSQAG